MSILPDRMKGGGRDIVVIAVKLSAVLSVVHRVPLTTRSGSRLRVIVLRVTMIVEDTGTLGRASGRMDAAGALHAGPRAWLTVVVEILAASKSDPGDQPPNGNRTVSVAAIAQAVAVLMPGRPAAARAASVTVNDGPPAPEEGLLAETYYMKDRPADQALNVQDKSVVRTTALSPAVVYGSVEH